MSTVDMSCKTGSYGNYIKEQRTEKQQDRKISRDDRAREDAGGQGPFKENVTENGTFGRSMADAREAADAEAAWGAGKAAGTEKAGAAGKAMDEASAGSAEKTAGNADKADGAAVSRAAAGSPQDMSPVEYIQYINSWITELSRRSHNRNKDVFIYISEEGYRAMQNDPEYEAWVMQSIRDAYGYSRSWCGHDVDYHSVHLFGATKEEYRGQTWSSGCGKCEDRRRQEQKLRRKKQMKAYLKKQQERKRLERLRLEKLHIEKEVYKKLLAKRRLERDRLEEEHREKALARREEASAFRMYMAILKYSEQ